MDVILGQMVDAVPHDLVPVGEPIVCLEPSVERARCNSFLVPFIVPGAVLQEVGQRGDGAT